MFKPNVSPLLLDQMTSHVPKVKTLKTGERVIEDPEHSTERVMLWFYLLINVGAFVQVGTSYAEKYVGWWLSWLIPLVLYVPLPLLMWFLKKRLVLHKPGGSDLPNVFRVMGYCMRNGGIFRIGRKGWWEPGKPSVQAAMGLTPTTRWNDQFVDDVRRSVQATGMFCFFPVQFWNDNGIGNAASYLSTMLRTDGAPNDVLNNFNPFAIIFGSPLLNFGLYPLLRRWKIHYGPVMRICTGFFLSTCAGIAYTVLQYYTYKTNPCGYYGSTDPICVDGGLTSEISVWWMAVPYGIGGFSELFINVPAYGIAYSRAPVNMRGVVSALNLFNTAIAYIVNLAASPAITDPNLIWDFGGPTIVGAVVTVLFVSFACDSKCLDHLLTCCDRIVVPFQGGRQGGIRPLQYDRSQFRDAQQHRYHKLLYQGERAQQVDQPSCADCRQRRVWHLPETVRGSGLRRVCLSLLYLN